MLVAEKITKRFPGVIALQDVYMELPEGKVTAILGENGAGKSTLMKILSGVYPEYEGKIVLDGKEVTFSNPKEAQEKGIAIIHQELNLVPQLSITENIFLGRELIDKWGTLDSAAMRTRTLELLKKLKLEVNPDCKIAALKVGQQQVVEIAKALLTDCRVIIMDEPTSAITQNEVEVLFGLITSLRNENKIIAYISHKLDELFKIADRFVVLRDGRTIESGEMKNIDHDSLIKKMVGRDISLMQNKGGLSADSPLLSIEKLSLSNRSNPKKLVLDAVTLKVQRGEILGLFGLMGAGRTELLETIAGLHGKYQGSISLNGQQVVFSTPAAAILAGVALVPEDRKKDGLVLGLDVKTNISLTTIANLRYGGLLSERKENELASAYIGSLKIKTPSPGQLVKNLSGGNQQKIVLAKCLATNPKLLMLDEPTRGIDINAKNEIYKLILELAASGMAVIVVSSELPEVLAISDRIMVMAEGRITAEFKTTEADETMVLQAAISKTN